jgi:hypothetical protein
MAEIKIESRIVALETQVHGELQGRLTALEKWRGEMERNIWRVLLAALGLGCMGYIHIVAGKLGL